MSQECRILTCDMQGCGARSQEIAYEKGFPGWGGLVGILKDKERVILCPQCLKLVCGFLDKGIS